jgi:hypothetical protein
MAPAVALVRSSLRAAQRVAARRAFHASASQSGRVLCLDNIDPVRALRVQQLSGLSIYQSTALQLQTGSTALLDLDISIAYIAAHSPACQPCLNKASISVCIYRLLS